MKRKILIEKSKNKIRTYLIEDDDIVEIHTSINEEQVPPGKLGDIYIGKVQNIVQNIGAAFIEITKGVNCYFDLKDAENAYFTHKSGKKPLCIGDELVVQPVKDLPCGFPVYGIYLDVSPCAPSSVICLYPNCPSIPITCSVR